MSGKSKIRRYWFRFKDHHPRYIFYARVYAIIWLILILFDVHRYGCWITGDKSYMYAISYWLIPITLLPFLPLWISWATRTHNTWTLKFFLWYIPLCLGAVAGVSGGHIFDVAWYDTNWIRHDDSLIGGIVILVIVLPYFLYCSIKNINPWE